MPLANAATAPAALRQTACARMTSLTAHRGVHLALLGRVEARRLRGAHLALGELERRDGAVLRAQRDAQPRDAAVRVLAAEQRLREEIAKERREANARARERFSGSLHVEDLEGDLQRTWESRKAGSNGGGKPIVLQDLVHDISSKSMESGIDKEEAEAEAQVTALVSALFLTNRGYVDLKQEKGRNGKITLKDLWTKEDDFSLLSEKLHPKTMTMEAVKDV